MTWWACRVRGEFACRFAYKVRGEAGGIARALGLAEDFTNGQPLAVILGDNIFQANLRIHALTRWDGEHYCRLFCEQTHLRTVSLRYFNVFGARQDPAGPYAAAIPIFIEHATTGRPISIFGDGEQTRDFVFVKDVVAANIHFCMHSEAVGTFNIGYGQAVSVNQLARRILSVLKSTSPIRYAPERPGDVKHSTAGIAKACAAGFTPTWTFDQGLAETLKSWRM